MSLWKIHIPLSVYRKLRPKVIMDSEDCLILDVRELDEYQEGHIKGAKLLALSSLKEETVKDEVDNTTGIDQQIHGTVKRNAALGHFRPA